MAHKQKPAPVFMLAALALLVGALFGYSLSLWRPSATRLVAVPVQTVTQARYDNSVSLKYPMTIAAQRQRTYPGGTIALEQLLPGTTGYNLSRVSYPSDGNKIYALEATPLTPMPAGGYPVIILAHGYVPLAQYKTDGPQYQAELQAFTAAGYLVLKPDFRGHGQSWGTSLGGYYSPGYTADLLNLAASLKSLHIANAEQVGLFGHSMGGHVVMNALAVWPTRFQAAVTVAAAVGQISDMYHWQAPSDRDNPGAQAERLRMTSLFGDPAQNPGFWTSISPYPYLQDITTSIQMHHDVADPVVPLHYGQQMQSALQAAGKPVQFYTYPGFDHSFTGPTQSLMISRAVTFYNQKMKP